MTVMTDLDVFCAVELGIRRILDPVAATTPPADRSASRRRARSTSRVGAEAREMGRSWGGRRVQALASIGLKTRMPAALAVAKSSQRVTHANESACACHKL